MIWTIVGEEVVQLRAFALGKYIVTVGRCRGVAIELICRRGASACGVFEFYRRALTAKGLGVPPTRRVHGGPGKKVRDRTSWSFPVA